MVNVDHLIKKYAEATQRVKEYWDDRDNRNYWQGMKEALNKDMKDFLLSSKWE